MSERRCTKKTIVTFDHEELQVLLRSSAGAPTNANVEVDTYGSEAVVTWTIEVEAE